MAQLFWHVLTYFYCNIEFLKHTEAQYQIMGIFSDRANRMIADSYCPDSGDSGQVTVLDPIVGDAVLGVCLLILILVSFFLLTFFFIRNGKQLKNTQGVWSLFATYINAPDGQIKRIGFILIIISSVIWGISAINWSAKSSNKGFIYKVSKDLATPTPKPTETLKGAGWQVKIRGGKECGWDFVDEACFTRVRKKEMFLMIPPQECIIKYVPNKSLYQEIYKSNFAAFFRRSLSQHSKYFWINMPATVLFFIGWLMLIGIIDKVIFWIRSGNSR